MLDVSNNPHDFSRDILRQFKNWDSEHLMIVPNMKYMNYNYTYWEKKTTSLFFFTYIGQRELSIIDKTDFKESQGLLIMFSKILLVSAAYQWFLEADMYMAHSY